MEKEARRKKRAREIVAKRFRLFIRELAAQFKRSPEELLERAEERARTPQNLENTCGRL